jgi:hypothetical protein
VLPWRATAKKYLRSFQSDIRSYAVLTRQRAIAPSGFAFAR